MLLSMQIACGFKSAAAGCLAYNHRFDVQAVNTVK